MEEGTGRGHSIRIDAPTRYSDASGDTGSSKLSPEQHITNQLKHRFDNPSSSSSTSSSTTFPSAHRPPSPASRAPSEVLEPHTLPPGARPRLDATPLQAFCGAPAGGSSSWGALTSGGHLSQCFVQAFLFGAVDIAFIILAALRLRHLLALPPPPPRSLTRGQLLKASCSSMVAVYHLIMFAVHLAFDYGEPYQWLMYPSSCLTWSLCTFVLLTEAKYGAPSNYVCKSFWLVSFVVATIMLWTNSADQSVSRLDEAVFMVHYALYAAMACLAVFHKEDTQDYSQLALDFSEISFEEEEGKTEATDETRTGTATSQPRTAAGGKPPRGGGLGHIPVRRLVLLFSEEKWLVAAAFACCLIGAPIEVVQFIYVGMIVDDCAIPDGPNTLPEYTAVLVALYLIESVSSSSQLIVTMMVGERMSLRLRKAVFQCAVRQEVGFTEGPGGAAKDVASILEKDVQKVQEAASVQMCMLLQSLIQVLVGGVFLLVLSWKLTLVGLAILPVIALMMLAQTTVLQSYSKRSVEALERVEIYAAEILSGIRAVRSCGKEGKERNRLGGELLQVYTVARSLGIANGVAEGLGVLVLKMCLVMGLFYGGSLVHNDELSGGILVSYVFIALQVIMSLSVLPPLIGDMSHSITAADRIFHLLDRHPKINTRGGLTLPSIEGRVELRHVTFSYPSASDHKALDRVSLTVDPGEHVCICGPAGSGKSTALAMIERFFDPREGLVLLDDTDVATFDPQWLRQLIGFVPQQTMLFTRTIEANIAFGSDASRQQVVDAATLVGVHEAILALPQGYNTVVGTHPTTLDKPFRQRLCIARAALKDPRILLLDEPTGGLSRSDASQVEEALALLCTGRTVISVAHRAAVPKGVGRVVVFRRGQVAEHGTVGALLAAGGIFAAMHSEGGEGRASGAGEHRFASDDRDEEDELSGGGARVGAGSRQGKGHGGQAMQGGSRAYELIEDVEHEMELCKPTEGMALSEVRGEIAALKRLLGKGRQSSHTI